MPLLKYRNYAIVEVKVFGKSRFSKVQNKTGSGATFWGEHFFFEKTFDTTYELEDQKIVISVLDHSSIGFSGLIGTVELSIPTVYYKDKHVVQYQWAALSGLTNKFQEVLGFLKFSVGVFAADDIQAPLNEEKNPGALTGPTKTEVIYPPQIVTVAHQIRVRVFRGDKLKKMDTFGKTDPYVHLIYGSQEIKSTTLKVTYDPVWNEELLLPASLPTINDRIILRLYDWDSGPMADELMGTVAFSIKDILDNKYKQPFWVNIYGAHSDTDVKYEKMQNETPELATEWKGRLELAITMRQEDKPIVGFGPLKDPAAIKTSENYRKETYDLRAEIHYAMNLPQDKEDYMIRIRWGPVEVTTKKRTSTSRMIEFYENLTLQGEFPVGASSELEIPDVFIYLNNGKKDVSYCRKSWLEFTNPNTKTRPFYFKVDRGLSSTRDDLAGIVKMRLLVSKPGDKSSLSLYGWDKPAMKRQAQTAWKIHFNIFQARDLIAGDSSGLSDPFLNIYGYGTELHTTVIPETLNPIWNERLEFSAPFETVDDAPPFVLTMWDKDELSADDFLGSAIVTIEQKDLNPSELPKPKWVDLIYGKNGGKSGKVLLSVCCYNRQDLIPRTPYIAPDTMKYYINMKILGLRELESTGILPVKRAFIKFDVDSLRSRAEKSYLHEKKFIKTEPKDTGSNPNILTVVNLEIDLPADAEYCPSLNCAVYDYILRGLSQPLIGNFSIPLGDFMKSTSAELERRIEKLSALFYANQPKEGSAPAPVPAITKENPKKAFVVPIEETKEDKSDNDISDFNLDPAKQDGGLKPLLGKFAAPMVERFELIKKAKGNLPGEDDEVHIDIFDDLESPRSEDDPTHDITEEAKASKKFVVHPKYRKTGDEYNKPDMTKYMELGHNNKDRTCKKHYRYLFDKELEKTDFMDASPFFEIPIHRGRRVTEESFFANLFEKNESYRCVGHCKAMINVMNEFDKMKYDAKLQHVGKFAQTKGFEFSDEEFLRRKDVTIRLYVIEAEGLADRDDDSNSDPYLIVKLGKVEYNDSKNYQLDNPNPTFNKCFEFTSSLPGASKLSIQLWDYDALSPDDLIGKTEIDIEDRWYSPKWRNLKYIPIETRQLYHPSSKLPQGSVKLWLEILPADLPKPPIWTTSPKPPVDYELRVVVWECKDVPRVDVEDAVDIYITGKVHGGKQLTTDTHIRSQDGKGSFNWRMVFPVQLRMKKHRITFQIWDKDALSADDYISEATLDFDNEALLAFEKEDRVTIYGTDKKEEKFWVQCSNNKGPAGQVLISMALIPKDQAELAPVGQGRANPNQLPYLPPPEGRMEWTWNVVKLYKRLIGPAAREAVIKWASIILCGFILLMTIPILIAKGVSGIF